MTYERANISAMTGYAPGEQPDSDEVIKLNTNENPFPPGPAVDAALASLKGSDLRRYPPPTARALREAIASLHGVDADNIIVTNGGDELLRLAYSTFVEVGEKVGVAEPSYSLYPVLAAAHGAQYVTYDLDSAWQLPSDFAARLNEDGIKLCFVVNPHAPTGLLTSASRLESLAREFRGVLVIDEAYVDFIDPALGYSSLPLINRCNNVLILRTFSKGYSLAGLRMAYGIASKELVAPMQYKTKDSYNTDFIAQKLASAAISDQIYARETWQYVRNQRDQLSASLTRLGFDCIPSQSNFLLARVPKGISARGLYEYLKSKGILVRFFNLPRLDDKLRITVGTEAENQRMMAALKATLPDS